MFLLLQSTHRMLVRYHPTIGQLYVPEPSRAAQLIAGVAGLLGIAAWRARKSR